MSQLGFFLPLAQQMTDEQARAMAAGAGIVAMIVGLVGLVFAIVMIAAQWKIFAKAGKPGWACLVPIYNAIVMLEIVGRPAWWFILMLIPGVSIIIAFIVVIDLAKSFGKGTGFAIGMIFLGIIFIPMLGFGDAEYLGPVAKEA